MPDLATILDREFSKLDPQGDLYRTLQSRAQMLGVDKATLSRYQAGVRVLTRNRATQFARKLRGSGLGGEELSELVSELLAARVESVEDAASIDAWFSQRGNERVLMSVEFREPPVISKDTAQPQVVNVVARAIASGLHYAMFLPFSSVTTTDPHVPLDVRMYVSQVRKNVLLTHNFILDQALHEAERDAQATNSKLTSEDYRRVCERLKLYILKEPEKVPAARPIGGIGYRLFYVEEFRDDSSSSDAQLWQWISFHKNGKLVHEMIMKLQNQTELNAVATILFPVAQFWRDRGRLPGSADISSYLKLPSTQSEMASLEIADSTWGLHDATPYTAALIKTYTEKPGKK